MCNVVNRELQQEGKKVTAFFVDLGEAFDSIDRRVQG